MGGRKETGDLVSPRSVERMLGDRHDLDVGEPHFENVIGEHGREFAVGERAVGVLDLAFPGGEMDLVDGDGAVDATGLGGAFIQPGGVAPLVDAGIVDDGGVAGRSLEVGAVGVGLDEDVGRLVEDLVFVEFALAETGDEQLPHAGGAERAHGVVAAVPVVEIAHDRHAGGAGRPDGERHAGHPVDHTQVGAEFFVDAVLVALVEKVEVLVAERGEERIRVKKLADLAAAQRDAELVAENGGLVRDEDLEKALRREQLHLDGRGGLVTEVHNLAGLGVADEGPHQHALRTAFLEGAHAQEIVGAGVAGFKKGGEFDRGDDHVWGRIFEGGCGMRMSMSRAGLPKQGITPVQGGVSPYFSGRRRCR